MASRGQWPTPRAHETVDVLKGTRDRNGADNLATAIARLYSTPTAQDAKNNGAASQHKRDNAPLNAEVGGALNPDWVEWLMGWPVGATDLHPLRSTEPLTWDHEPDIPRVTHVKHRRVARLRMLGNGQVPATAVLAWALLNR